MQSGTPCSNLNIPKNGFHNGTTDETIRPGTTLVFGCNVGYHLIGDDTLTCSVYGQWSGSMPQCEGITYYVNMKLITCQEVCHHYENFHAHGSLILFARKTDAHVSSEKSRDIIKIKD